MTTITNPKVVYDPIVEDINKSEVESTTTITNNNNNKLNLPKPGLKGLQTIDYRERRESGFSEGIPLPSIPQSLKMMLNVTNSSAASSRRESFDSGLAFSPARQFPFEMDEHNSSSPLSSTTTSPEPNNKINESTDVMTSTEPSSNATNVPRIRKKKKKRLCESWSITQFQDVYKLTDECLGEGSYGRVETCVNLTTGREYAVKIISKDSWHFNRPKMLKEIELYHLCRGQKEIIQLIEYFEESDKFYLVFEKAEGGPLLTQIQRRVHFTETEAAAIIRDLAAALAYLHGRGIAHRDLKPENVLCSGDSDNFLPVKLCDFDLCSAVYQTITTPKLQSPVGSVEYMAPEVVEAFTYDMDFFMDDDLDGDEDCDVELSYDKRCDLWSLGIIAYILLCGYLPFSGRCGEDCGWDDRGEECPACQSRLFQSIRSGNLVFPEQHWSGVSKEAKDLITKLLVRDASQRLEAASVLNHPWIVQGGNCANNKGAPLAPLETPSVLRRRESVHDMTSFYSEFASNAQLAMQKCGVDENNENVPPLSQMKKSATSTNLLTKQCKIPTTNCNSNNLYRPPHLKSANQDILNFLSGGGGGQDPTMQRQQKVMAKQMRRQTSLVVFPEDMGCRWEF